MKNNNALRRILIAAPATAALLAIAPASAAPEGSMVGRWFTEGVERGVHIQVFIDNHADGSYLKDVRAIENCEVAGSGKETGKWTFEKGNFATASEMLDGNQLDTSSPDTHDLFTVTHVDDAHLNLYDTKTKLTWALIAVTKEAGFPAPRGCSV